MPTLHEIADFLHDYLRVAKYPAEQSGILRPSERHVHRLGLALEPSEARVIPMLHDLDALLLHRSWGYEAIGLAANAGVLGYHQPFDDRLTIGDNPFLASAFGLSQVEHVHHADGRIIGLIGDVAEQAALDMMQRISAIFGGLELGIDPNHRVVGRVAIVGAMTDALVRDASARGATLYVTGQLRHPAKDAVAVTGIGVAAIGHARLERWGLGCLETVLQEQWPALVMVQPAHAA